MKEHMKEQYAQSDREWEQATLNSENVLHEQETLRRLTMTNFKLKLLRFKITNLHRGQIASLKSVGPPTSKPLTS